MKKLIQKTVAILAVAAIVLTSSVTAFAANGRWIKSGSRWWYRHSDASYTVNGWEKIGGKWYHFDRKGWMQTGWLKTGNKWYYLNPNGDMRIGWLKDKGKWYYLQKDGSMVVGCFSVKNPADVYYTDSRGALAEGWTQIDDNLGEPYWAYFDKPGKMVYSRWIGDDYVDQNGHYVEQPGLTMDREIYEIYITRKNGFKYSSVKDDIEDVREFLEAIRPTGKRANAPAAVSDRSEYWLTITYFGENGYQYWEGQKEDIVVTPDGALFCEGFCYTIDYQAFLALVETF